MGGASGQRTAIIGFLAAVLVGNLVLMLSQPRTTHALPDPADKRPGVVRLANRKVSSYPELTEAAAAAGLRLSRRFVATVDMIFRIDEQHVTMGGWLADTDGDGTPLDVVVFVAGTVVAAAPTQGERPDVTEKVRLGFGAEKNVAFRVNFLCRAGDQPVVAGLGPKERYVPVRSPPCP
jgi:hypothetical protein